MEYNIQNIAPIVLLPFFAFVINAFIVKKFTKTAIWISCSAIFASFIYSARIFSDFIFVKYSSSAHIHKVFNWFDLSANGRIFKVDMGIYIDNMTAVMLLMVTSVAFFIHLFSTYYMRDDERYGRFFVYLSLFTSAMLGLVLSDNLLSVFIFWELMGFCSYSLIGFYYEKESAGNASMKAFMTTRVGDVFFLLGILAIWSVVGSVSFVDLYAAIADGKFNDVYALGIPLATFAGLAIFMGTIGKSAQFPLQVWLPDAMSGPTPCSALIHAATMVAAGVYLSLRVFPLLELGNLTLFISYIGAITAFAAATIALIQTDIKAVLAYSTISQLGYMVLGVGVGSYNAAFMHLITHAIFKACLFLSAGSVIHSLHDHHTHGHVQEMPRMGGLRHKMKFTWFVMWCCTFAISGIPFFSGFVSKDRILGDALLKAINYDIWYSIPALLGFVAACLTAFYMFRMMFLTFHGKPRDKELYDHTHEEKLQLGRNVPLLILSVFTLGIWFSGSLTGQGLVKVADAHHGKYEWFQTLIKAPEPETFKSYIRSDLSSIDSTQMNVFPHSTYDHNHGYSEENAHLVHKVHSISAVLSIFIALLGIFIARGMYLTKSMNPAKVAAVFPRWYKALENKYYFDDLYLKGLIGKVLLPVNRLLAWIDMGIYDRIFIDGWASVVHFCSKASNLFDNIVVDTVAVDGTGASVKLFNVILRVIQSGKIQFYFITAIFVLFGYFLTL